MRITREADGQRKLFIQSSVNWGIFFNGQTRTMCGVVCKTRQSEIWAGCDGRFWDDGTLVENNTGAVNLSWLGAVDLSGGVTFVLGSTPMSAQKLDEFRDKFRLAVRQLYRAYMVPVDFAVEITSREIDVVVPMVVNGGAQ